jgi:hypothetical protein
MSDVLIEHIIYLDRLTSVVLSFLVVGHVKEVQSGEHLDLAICWGLA